MASEKPMQKKEEKNQEIGKMPVVFEANESNIITPNRKKMIKIKIRFQKKN